MHTCDSTRGRVRGVHVFSWDLVLRVGGIPRRRQDWGFEAPLERLRLVSGHDTDRIPTCSLQPQNAPREVSKV